MPQQSDRRSDTAANRQESESVGTISHERKALDFVIQASRADPRLREAVLEVEKWINRLIESRNEAWQTVNEIEEDADRDFHYQADLRHQAYEQRDYARAALQECEKATQELRLFATQCAEVICDYVDAYEDGDGERASHMYERLYEIGTGDTN